uniref:BACK domain-containing protein n=1 Tax=Biomphalaria glabrata TaxID=6526 RepID=A0A2C9LA57_BIOGL
MQISDVLKLIQSQDLETTSEDDVVHALLKWVEFRPRQQDETSEDSNKEFMFKNSCHKIFKTGYTRFETSENQQQNKYITIDSHDDSRNQNIPDLLSNTRTCLLSTKCLEMLSCHPLVRENKVATDIIIEALFYQFQVGKRSGHWPPGAIYRKNGNHVNAAVAVRKTTNESIVEIKAFSFLTKQWLQLPCLYSNASVAFVANDKSLYALSEQIAIDKVTFLRPNFPSKRQILRFTNGAWSEVSFTFNLPPEPFVVSADAFIYILSKASREVWQLDLTARISVRMTDIPFTVSISHVTNYEQFILAFYNKTEEEYKAAVCCFDTSQNLWRKLDDLNGSAQGMISFKDIHSTYLTQTNGNLWMLELQSDDIKFKHVAKLWSCDWSLHGAVTFGDELYIYGVRSEALKQDFQKQLFLDGIFNQIVYMESEDTESSSFIPVTLSRQSLVQI